MAHYMFTAQGSRGQTHRLGHKKTGGEVEARSWHDGVRVWARYNEETDTDEYTIDFTGGSSGDSRGARIGTLKKEGNTVIFSLNSELIIGNTAVPSEIVFKI